MTITATQIREARRLLRRTSRWLMRTTGVDFSVVVKAQRDEEIASVDPTKLRAIRKALETAGAEFIPTYDGTPSVRVKAGWADAHRAK